MRFLIDANLSPRVATTLSSQGFKSIHVGDVGLLTAADQAILDYAAANELVIISADTDFGELLAISRGAVRPSVVLLRSADHITPEQQAALLAANLPAVADELGTGALVTIARGRSSPQRSGTSASTRHYAKRSNHWPPTAGCPSTRPPRPSGYPAPPCFRRSETASCPPSTSATDSAEAFVSR
jgi:predicted nuclease of predicted toxin-antitoxin system